MYPPINFLAKNGILAFAFVGPFFCGPCWAQLKVLSSGNVAEQWRNTQIESIVEQAKNLQLSESLQKELRDQLEWLKTWEPGDMSHQSVSPQREFPAVDEEPIIDPDGHAAELRKKLFDAEAQPTEEDTQSLRDALIERPNDPGLRQLHVHWLDQFQYRKTYARQIADSARKLAVLLEQGADADSDTYRLVRGFCYFRSARALAYCELPEVVAKQPIEDPELHEAELLGAYSQMKELLSQDRPELVLLEVRMLRRDNWLGQALMLLERSASAVELQWYLKKRRDLLEELSWTIPAKEAGEIYAKHFPEAVAEER